MSSSAKQLGGRQNRAILCVLFAVISQSLDRRFEDLPVAQLATSHKDPEVAAGLAAIAKLDAQLQEANLKVGACHKHHSTVLLRRHACHAACTASKLALVEPREQHASQAWF
jgi:hypothetical protein